MTNAIKWKSLWPRVERREIEISLGIGAGLLMTAVWPEPPPTRS